MTLERLTPGMSVITADGHKLGNVKEIAGDCFKVDIPMWPDHWLSLDSVNSTSGAEVHLNAAENEVAERVKEGVGHTGFHVHDSDQR